MALPDGFIDELKARVRPSELIGRTVALRKEGREYRGLSPFKKEKTPSFFVNDEKGFYHDFSSGKHGDVISWLQETQGLSFMEAVEALAAEAGLSVPRDRDPEAGRREARRKGLIEWMEAAQAWFERQLRASSGREARAYLERRGLKEADWARFGLGFAPASRRALMDTLSAEGAPVADLVEAGLLIAPEDGSAPYDRFRDRVMFPIRDPRGRLVAFGGRALSKEARAKYLNSPETPIFHKGSMLWRFPEARTAAADPKRGVRGLLVAEGYMDVIALARAGLEHAVAPLGTALTEDQLNLLWRAGDEPTVCLDGDSAGRRAAATAAERALPLLKPGRTLRFVFLPDGADPDDLLRDQGADALVQAVSRTEPLVEVLWRREAGLEPLDTPEARAGLRSRLRALCARIEDPDVKAEYRAEFDRRLDAMFARPRSRPARGPARGGGYRAPGFEPGPTAELRAKRKVRSAAPSARQLLLALVEYPAIAEAEAELLAELDFGPLDSLRDAVLDACSFGKTASSAELRRYLLEECGMNDLLDRLEAERGPMRAAMGGEVAASEARRESWRAVAVAYMEQTAEDARDADERPRLAAAIGAGDSDEMKRLIGDLRRARARSKAKRG